MVENSKFEQKNQRRWSLAQVDASGDFEDNLRQTLNLIESARTDGCSLIAFPENFLLRGDGDTIRTLGYKAGEEGLKQLRKKAKEEKINIIAGSIPEPVGEAGGFYNTAYFIDSTGEISAFYRKIHLFDIELADEFKLREADYLKPGKEVAVVDFDGFKCGVGICYDLRFPELFRQLSKAGAEVIFVPACFTDETGKVHWRPLLQARAIENQCYVIAPAQTGKNRINGVDSHGNSLVVDPWGQVVAEKKRRPGLLNFTINRNRINEIRRKLPALQHRELN